MWWRYTVRPDKTLSKQWTHIPWLQARECAATPTSTAKTLDPDGHNHSVAILRALDKKVVWIDEMEAQEAQESGKKLVLGRSESISDGSTASWRLQRARICTAVSSSIIAHRHVVTDPCR